MKVSSEQLASFCRQIFQSVGLPEAESQIAADNLVEANLRGIDSHGVSRLRAYARRIEAGVVNTDVEPKILNASSTAMHLDGCNAMGAPLGVRVMQMCMERAAEHGSGFAAVCNANHFGIGAYYTQLAAKHNMIGIAMSNAPASVVPTGGRKPMLGTNPLSIAIPARSRPPLVLDMASSVVAQGKIILAKKQGQTSIPEGWAVDDFGAATTDPEAALRGAMLPFGGPKGYAIALIIDVLCSALSGALSSTKIHSFWEDLDNPQGLGIFMGAWSIEHFVPMNLFQNRAEELFHQIKQCPPASGFDEVLIPGELEHRHRQFCLEHGIDLDETVSGDLQKLAEEYGVAFNIEELSYEYK